VPDVRSGFLIHNRRTRFLLSNRTLDCFGISIQWYTATIQAVDKSSKVSEGKCFNVVATVGLIIDKATKSSKVVADL
jgi:hypothetical protein